MGRPPESSNDGELSEAARRRLEQAEAGDAGAARKLDEARAVDPVAVDAAEQEASDGPAGLGLER